MYNLYIYINTYIPTYIHTYIHTYLYHTVWEVKRSRHGVQIPCTPWRHLWS